MEGEVVGSGATDIESVNKHLLEKLDYLILHSDSFEDPDMIRALTESIAKLNTSLRNNNIFSEEDPEEKRQKNKAQLAEEILRGKVSS